MSDSATPSSPPGSSFHGIFQARKLQWVVMPCSRRSSWSLTSLALAGRIFTTSATWEVPRIPHVQGQLSWHSTTQEPHALQLENAPHTIVNSLYAATKTHRTAQRKPHKWFRLFHQLWRLIKISLQSAQDIVHIQKLLTHLLLLRFSPGVSRRRSLSVDAGIIRCLPWQYPLPCCCTSICSLCPEGPACSCWIVDSYEASREVTWRVWWRWQNCGNLSGERASHHILLQCDLASLLSS